MRIPNQAIEMIKKYEGFSDKPYVCSAGQWTIGYGTSYYVQDGRAVTKNDPPISEGEAFFQLYATCARKCARIIEDFQEMCGRKFNDNELTALYSLLYNIRGANGFCKTKCAAAIARGDNKEAIRQWDWFHAKKDGKTEILPGLIERRNKEIELFFGVKDYWKVRKINGRYELII